MDLSLPSVSGLEATRRIKADPTLQHIPIIAVTAHAKSADAAKAQAFGCSAYLSKPYALRELMQLIDAHALQLGAAHQD
jgi:two-component system cell cycle response regulator DivK